MKRILQLSSAAALACCTGAVMADQPVDAGGPPEIVVHSINPRGLSRTAPPTGSAGVITPAINWNGGPVLATPHVYIIWYGNWNKSSGSDTASGRQIVTDFLQSLAASVSPYFSINQTYSIGGTTITGVINFNPSIDQTFDSYSQGSRLRDSSIQNIVSRSLGTFGAHADGVYFVLTSSDVSEQSGFCTRYCGWHTAATLSGTDIKYSFVGNAARCLSACAIQSTSPNGNAGVDGMVSVIAHELEESTSDPDLNAWYDSGGAENADKCAWTFGNSVLLSNGSYANMQLGTRNYLIQRNLYHTSSADYCEVSDNADPVAGQSWPTTIK